MRQQASVMNHLLGANRSLAVSVLSLLALIFMQDWVIAQPQRTVSNLPVRDNHHLDDSLAADRIAGALTKALADGRRLIVVRKSAGTLSLYVRGVVDTTFRVVFGRNGLGDKQRAWDGLTPEGLFTIGLRTNEPLSHYYESLMLNYPLPEDADRGLSVGLIDRLTHRRIRDAHERGEMPDQRTALGGDICIHGGGATHNWTMGCIALDNDDMKYLFDRVRIDDRCLIIP